MTSYKEIIALANEEGAEYGIQCEAVAGEPMMTVAGVQWALVSQSEDGRSEVIWIRDIGPQSRGARVTGGHRQSDIAAVLAESVE